jgi:hypothetical protein
MGWVMMKRPEGRKWQEGAPPSQCLSLGEKEKIKNKGVTLTRSRGKRKG